MRQIFRITLFFADFLPLFLIFYFIEFDFSINYYGILVVGLSAASNLAWYAMLRDANKYGYEEYTVVDTEDRGSQYMSYIVSYAATIPPIVLISGVVGYVVFVIIILILLSMYVNNDVLFYNPLLPPFGYRFMRVKIKEGGEVFVIGKKTIKQNSKAKMHLLDDSLFLLDD